jgi:hypothetical protein
LDYKKIYNAICKRAKDQLELRKESKKQNIYYEGHHIVPECMGGLGNSKKWDHPNIAPLTAKEHFLVHKLLVLIHPDNYKIACALWSMCNMKFKNGSRYHASSKDFEFARETRSKKLSERQIGIKRPEHSKKLLGKNHFFYGKKRPEISEIISEKLKKNTNACKKLILINKNIIFESINEAAFFLNISPRTVTIWAKKEKKIKFL